MVYLFTVQSGFWFGRDRFWTRNLDTIFQVCSEILFGWDFYRVEAYLISCLSSIWCKFLLRGVSEYVLVLVTFLLLLIMVSSGRRGRVQFWKSCMLMACSFINNEILCALTGLLSVGECISSKGNGQPFLLLEMNFTMDIRYFTSSFHHVFMLQLILYFVFFFYTLMFQFYCLQFNLFP